MLDLSNITRQYGERIVLKDLTHSFPQTGIVAVMGPSGCGKTTLLRLLSGLDQPDCGTVTNTYQKISVAFQEPRLVPWLSCLDNLRLILPKNSVQTAHLWLERLELSSVEEKLPHALSGGMKQRLSLARALAFGGDLLLLDEPFSALDEELKQRIAPMLREANPQGLTILVTHDEKEAALLGADILRCSGTPLSHLKTVSH